MKLQSRGVRGWRTHGMRGPVSPQGLAAAHPWSIFFMLRWVWRQVAMATRSLWSISMYSPPRSKTGGYLIVKGRQGYFQTLPHSECCTWMSDLLCEMITLSFRAKDRVHLRNLVLNERQHTKKPSFFILSVLRNQYILWFPFMLPGTIRLPCTRAFIPYLSAREPQV